MDIKYETLEKELNNQKLNSIYLLYGEEKYLIDFSIKKVKKAFGELVQGINYVIIDETNVNDLVYNIEVPAFGYDKKLIIIKNSGLFKKDGRKKDLTPIQKEVAEYIKNNISLVNEMVVLVFVEDSVDKNAVYDVINENGIICDIAELSQNDLIKKMLNICAGYKVNCTQATLSYFIEVCGTNLQVLINEIRKLIEYAGENGTITNESIDKLCIKKIESVIFELTDNLGAKKIGNALEILDNLIYQKEPIQKILITLYNHFKKLYLCSIAVNLNKNIAQALELKPNQTFLVSKYKKQISYFKQSELRKILNELIEIDYKSKNGLIDADIALRTVLCNYCS